MAVDPLLVCGWLAAGLGLCWPWLVVLMVPVVLAPLLRLWRRWWLLVDRVVGATEYGASQYIEVHRSTW
jgi:hypothetical protein